MNKAEQSVNLRIVHDGSSPAGWAGRVADFGVQDKNGEVHRGRRAGKGRLVFEISVGIKETSDGAPPVFLGPLVHGTPKDRFIYLSWRDPSGQGWTQRVKLPLASITRQSIKQSQRTGKPLTADATDRKPHDPRPVPWRVAAG